MLIPVLGEDMRCTTFFFSSPEGLESVSARLNSERVEHQSFMPSPTDPAIRIWAVSVNSEGPGRAQELIATSNDAIIGYYNLPDAERPLCDETPAHSSAQGDRSFIQKLWLGFIAQCFADPEKIRLIAHFSENIGPLLPYLNATLKASQYNPNEPTLSFKKGARMITLYSHKIAVAKADDLLDAWLCLKKAKDQVGYVFEHQTEIAPDFGGRKPPSALMIYKLLPQTNCGRCGKPACMAFAAVLANDEAEINDCLEFSNSRFEQKRSLLLELLG